MSKRTFQLLLVACLVTGTSWAADNPFVGKWKLNSSKSTIIDQMKVEAAGANEYAFTFVDNPETVVADGTDQPGLSGTTLSVTVEGPDTWKVVRKKDGRTLITAIWKLSDDGKTLTDAFTSHESDGTTHTVNFVYRRTTAGSGFPGTWESTSVNLDSVYELEIRSYEEDGLSFIIPALGKSQNIKFDGRDYPDTSANLPQGATGSGRRINERTLEIANKIEGKARNTQQIKLPPDLKTLTMTIYVPGRGRPNILVFDRE